MNQKKQNLKILYFYPELLNLYGDRGNIEILKKRAELRNIDVEIKEISLGQKLTLNDFKEANFIFMGGGSDLNQKTLYDDLVKNKRSFLVDYLASNKHGLFICGAYQLLGNYYQAEDGSKIDGLGICNFFTKNEGKKNRSVGKIHLRLNKNLNFSLKGEDANIFGFENHGGQTYFEENLTSFGEVVYGFGNDRVSKKEGLVFNNIIATYLHGPVLSLNPALADYLISSSTGIADLKELDDSFVYKARKDLLKN